MALNIFTLSVRNVIKHKNLSLINVIGLTAGFTAYILVSLFVHYEKSWDTHNQKYERIYRAQRKNITDFHATSHNNVSPHTCGITAKLMSVKCPEIEKAVVIEEIRSWHLANEKKQMFFDKTGCYIDPDALDVFTFDFVEGNKGTALVEPNSIVLSKSFADKMFPNQNALGKTIIAEKKITFKVTGIYRDLPLNSSLRPNFMVSMSSIENQSNVHNTLRSSFMVYVLLRQNADIKQVSNKVYDLLTDYDKKLEGQKLVLCPLSKIYLSFNDNKDYSMVLSLFELIGILILALSAINYINLTTANASIRTKETVVKKVLGAKSVTVGIQFLCESMALSLISLFMALIVSHYLLIPFNKIVNKDLILFSSATIPFIVKTFVVTTIIGVASGIYPAFFMVRNSILKLLKGNLFKNKKETFSGRKILVGFQFMVSIFLVAISLYISLQIRYLLNKNLGFSKENLIYTKFNSSNKEGSFNDLRLRLLQHPEITNVAIARHLPFISYGGDQMNWEGGNPMETTGVRDNFVSYDFFNTLGIKIIEGRNFSEEFPSDILDKCIVNETACKTFGWKNPVGMHVDDGKLQVIGVVKDFHFKDMHNLIEPAIIRLYNGNLEGDWSYIIRFNNKDYSKTLNILYSEFDKLFPNDPFEFYLLSEGFKEEKTFEVYHTIQKTIVFFSILTIILAIIGLLGLVSFITLRRTKEIGIRKINGSKPYQIFLLLNKELLILIILSSIIAWCFSAFTARNFPGNYKIDLEAWIMFIAIGLVILVSFMVSFYKTLKASRSNPVDSLKYE